MRRQPFLRNLAVRIDINIPMISFLWKIIKYYSTGLAITDKKKVPIYGEKKLRRVIFVTRLSLSK